ncbi:MAG: hypothetical protein ABW003_00050 [Microvirga sp.]
MRSQSVFVSVALAVSLPLPLQAHDMYTPLMDPWGKSCCDDHDCRPALYRKTKTGVQMLVDGRWIDVPDIAIQHRSLPGDAGETAGGHWCGMVREDYEQNLGPFYTTRCAILPPEASEADLQWLGVSGH